MKKHQDISRVETFRECSHCHGTLRVQKHGVIPFHTHGFCSRCGTEEFFRFGRSYEQIRGFGTVQREVGGVRYIERMNIDDHIKFTLDKALRKPIIDQTIISVMITGVDGATCIHGIETPLWKGFPAQFK